MEIQADQQASINDMVKRRGYVLDYHKVLTRQDFPVMQAADNLIHAVYLKERRLDRKTKELIFVTSLTVMRAEKAHIQSHIRVALKLGLSAEVVNAPNVQPFLPGNRHSCPECCTLTGKYPSKPFWSRLLCTVFVNSSRKLGAYLAQNHHQTTRETSWRLDKRSRSGIFVQSFVLLTTRRDSVFLFYVAREFTTIERRDQLVERVPDW